MASGEKSGNAIVETDMTDLGTGTYAILTQIIMEEEANGEQMLPVSFLRQLISMYGNSMQAMMPHYLEASMDSFRANQAKMQETFKSSVSPEAFAKLAENNMAMFQAAAEAFIPKAGAGKASAAAANDGDELSELRKQMKAMQDKLDKMGE